MTLLPCAFEAMLGVVTAHIQANGQLLQANAGFLRLLAQPAAVTNQVDVARFFIQPDFASLLKLCPADTQASSMNAAPVYSGLLTFGDFSGKTRSLQARVWVGADGLQLQAEFDIAALEQLNEGVLALNRAHAQVQVELVQSNFRLKQSSQQLQQANVELSAANARLAQTQMQLLQAEKLASIGLLAAGVAHEINNPAGFITSNISTLKRYVGHLLQMVAAHEAALAEVSNAGGQRLALEALKTGLDWAYLKEDVLALLDESQQGLARITRIVRALNDFACIDRAEVWQANDLHQSIDSALGVLGQQLKPGCDIRKEFGPLPLVQCVLPELNLVFLNLLRNAAQAIEAGGQILIRTGQQDGQVWVDVVDTGPGLSAAQCVHIFDPFFTTRAPGQGLGLGLSVAYGIVARHHGRIEVRSVPGQGAVFRVWLPVLQPTAHCESPGC